MLNIELLSSDKLPALHKAYDFYKGKNISNVEGLDILQKYLNKIKYDLDTILLKDIINNNDIPVESFGKKFYNIITVLNAIEESYGQPFDKDRYISFLNVSLAFEEEDEYTTYAYLDTSIINTIKFKDDIKFKEDITLKEVIIKFYTSLDLSAALLVLNIFNSAILYTTLGKNEGYK